MDEGKHLVYGNSPSKSDNPAIIAVLVFLIVFVTLLAYFPGLYGPWLLDDFPQLGPLLDFPIDHLGTYLDNFLLSNSGPLGRPVSMFTFALNAYTYGNDTWWWKYTNLLIHVLTGLFVLLFSARLFRTSRLSIARPWLYACFISGAWLLHPLNVSTVLYTVQRMTELSALFVFCGLLFYVSGRQRQIENRRGGAPLLGIAFLVCLPLAALSKENGLLFPLFCALIEALIFRFAGPPITTRVIKLLYGLFFAAMAIATIYLLANFDDIVLKGYHNRDYSFSERLLTQPRVLAEYILQIVVPIQQNMGFYHDDIVLSSGLLSPPATSISLVFLAVLFFCAYGLRNHAPLLSLGIVFFFVGHLIESSVFALEMMFEHRNYLPSLGILIAVAELVRQFLVNAKLVTTIAGICVLGLALLTWQRAATWSNPELMYDYMLRVHPESDTLRIMYANIHSESRSFDSAKEHISRIEDMAHHLHLLYLKCLESGRIENREFVEVITKLNGTTNAYTASTAVSIANLGLDKQCAFDSHAFLDVIDHLLRQPIRSFRVKQKLLMYKAHLLRESNQTKRALTVLQSVYELEPSNPTALYLASTWLLDDGRIEEAYDKFLTARDATTQSRRRYGHLSKPLYLALARAQLQNNSPDEALTLYQYAASEFNDWALPLIKKAELEMGLMRVDDARNTLRKLHTTLSPAQLASHQYLIKRLERRIAKGSIEHMQ
jgi:hypothetical protein